jgi:hypothetical protein
VERINPLYTFPQEGGYAKTADLEPLSRPQDSADHAAERAWSGFTSFITAQALLAAAWAALWTADNGVLSRPTRV